MQWAARFLTREIPDAPIHHVLRKNVMSAAAAKARNCRVFMSLSAYTLVDPISIRRR